MTGFLKALQEKNGFVSMVAATEEQIQNAQSQLGVLFSKEYRAYVNTFGIAAYEGHELTGIGKSSRLNVVNATLEEKEKNPNIPSDWYVIEQLHIDDVSIWQSGTGEVYQLVPGSAPVKICNSLVEYIEL
jgi:hypothetical protein